MHPSSLENMQRCYQRYILPSGLAARARAEVEVLDVGGANVNGSYRDVFSAEAFRYRSADISAEHVDIVLDDPYHLPLADASIDIVVSGQMLEHCEYFWLAFAEMVRVMKEDGFLFLIAPSAGPIHRYPVDCYRFYPDAYSALARLADCRLEAVWRDERGPWYDLVGVFRRSPLPETVLATAEGEVDVLTPPPPVASRPDAAEELTQGAEPYLAVLKRLHAALQPGSYLEIGVREGESFSLASCRAVGVDPAPRVSQALPPASALVKTTSDAFFESHYDSHFGSPPDLVFIDGMHLLEYALRDLMNVERRASPTTLVVIDDVFPNHPAQAARERTTRVWTGDVWKLYQCLLEQRPDLFLLPIDSAPTGLLLIAGLDAQNRVLWEGYNPLLRRYRDVLSAQPPASILNREGAVAPNDPLIGVVAERLRAMRGAVDSPQVVARELRALVSAS
jgi:hypothetical protein